MKRFGVTRWLVYAAVAVFLTVFALASRNPSYDVFSDYVSALGVGGGEGEWFNAGLVACAGLLLAFFFILGKSARDSGERLGALAGLVSSVGLGGVGVFPAGMIELHALFAGVFFGAALACWAALSFSAHARGARDGLSFSMGVLFAVSTLFFGLTAQPFLQLVGTASYLVWLTAFASQ